MALTDAQYDILRTDVLVTNQTEFATDVSNKDWQALADAYNLDKSPVYWCWKSSLLEKAIYESTVEGMGWNWATYKGQQTADKDAWARMWNPGQVNPSLQQTRDGWSTIFGNQPSSQAQLTYLHAVGRRHATRAEVLYVTADGNGTTATPTVLGWEGVIMAIDMAHCIDGVPI